MPPSFELPTDSIPLAEHQQRMLGYALETGFFAWAGVRLSRLEHGATEVVLTPRAEMLTPWGTLNGAVINALVELPAYLALATRIPAGLLPVTNDIFLQHLRPLPGAVEYSAIGRVLRMGKSMAWLETEVRVDGKATSLARITKSLVPRELP
ncbi:MAG: PaaI family thioesterase [Proteobacteria bacterium]|nr:PaaI family thioesterase [Pseudomonadota bacterium]HQR04256.1 PaaI family thioesterase [Rhodocyclaceae bacterium]